MASCLETEALAEGCMALADPDAANHRANEATYLHRLPGRTSRPASAVITQLRAERPLVPRSATVGVHDVQSAARGTEFRITLRYDLARQKLDRQPNHVLAVYLAAGI